MLTCHVPSFRDDVEGRADLAEEVMRIYGYDHIKGSVMKGDIRPGRLLIDTRKGRQGKECSRILRNARNNDLFLYILKGDIGFKTSGK